MVTWRILFATRIASVARMLSVTVTISIGDEAILVTSLKAGFESWFPAYMSGKTS